MKIIHKIVVGWEVLLGVGVVLVGPPALASALFHWDPALTTFVWGIILVVLMVIYWIGDSFLGQ